MATTPPTTLTRVARHKLDLFNKIHWKNQSSIQHYLLGANARYTNLQVPVWRIGHVPPPSTRGPSVRVVEELSTGKVLTTEWVNGERLDRSEKDDVTVLCSIAMNTYLTMMLELGTRRR